MSASQASLLDRADKEHLLPGQPEPGRQNGGVIPQMDSWLSGRLQLGRALRSNLDLTQDLSPQMCERLLSVSLPVPSRPSRGAPHHSFSFVWAYFLSFRQSGLPFVNKQGSRGEPSLPN